MYIIVSDELDAYIVVSFVNATLVLSIGDTVEEVMDSGFVGTTPTLSASAVGDDALLQVCGLAALLLTAHPLSMYFAYSFRPLHTLSMCLVYSFDHFVGKGHAIPKPMSLSC